MSDGVTIYPIERLGNQLFIYAAGLAAARRLSVPCYVNRGFFGPKGPNRPHTKEYALDRFNSGLVELGDDSYNSIPLLHFPGFPRLNSYWYNGVAPHLPIGEVPVFLEKSFSYDSRIRDVTSGTTLLGFFQSWKYFEDIAEEIRTRLREVQNPSSWLLSMQQQIVMGSGSIVLNVRRGDYKLDNNISRLGLTSRQYYVRALDVMRRLGLDGPVYVASDATDEAMQLLEGVADLIPISPPEGVDPFDVMLVLGRCDGLVAANSSFGWWSGFLGDSHDHVVIAPRPWFTAAELDDRDLLPSNWLTVDRE